jgi:hypothetical protein
LKRISAKVLAPCSAADTLVTELRTVLTHVDGAWEGLRFGEDGEAVVELSNGVIGLNLLSILWLQAHERNGNIERARLVGNSATVESVEQFVYDSRTITTSDGKSSGLK